MKNKYDDHKNGNALFWYAISFFIALIAFAALVFVIGIIATEIANFIN